MSNSSLLSRKFRSICLFGNPIFNWDEFVSPSTLHLTPFVKLILEPFSADHKFSLIELGLHEALVNAVRHGNLYDSNKVLRVRRVVTPNWLVLQIQDEGNGVPLNSRISSLPISLDAETGRGLFLIHECFDDVRWSRKGNRLQLSSRIK
tara:strand:+ start:531 stop:977 length:447 start_codon:yes stop_codon:yes gene_type:complete